MTVFHKYLLWDPFIVQSKVNKKVQFIEKQTRKKSLKNNHPFNKDCIVLIRQLKIKSYFHGQIFFWFCPICFLSSVRGKGSDKWEHFFTTHRLHLSFYNVKYSNLSRGLNSFSFYGRLRKKVPRFFWSTKNNNSF